MILMNGAALTELNLRLMQLVTRNGNTAARTEHAQYKETTIIVAFHNMNRIWNAKQMHAVDIRKI